MEFSCTNVCSLKPYLQQKIKAILLPMNHCLPTLSYLNECIKKSKEYFSNYSNDENIKIIILATSWWHKKVFDGSQYVYDLDHRLLSESR